MPPYIARYHIRSVDIARKFAGGRALLHLQRALAPNVLSRYIEQLHHQSSGETCSLRMCYLICPGMA